MRGFEPRSRHHDSSACSPITPHREEQLLSYPRDSALSALVSRRGSRHLYFTTRGLVGPFCPRRGRTSPFLRGHRRDTQLKCLTRWLAWSSHLSNHLTVGLAPSRINLALSLPVAKHCVCIKRVIPAKRWDQGTSASPYHYLSIHNTFLLPP